MNIEYHLLDHEIHSVHVRRAQTADAITLLFIHGLGESSLCFAEAIEHLPRNQYHLVMPDCIGYGRSSPARDQQYHFSRQLDRLQALAQAMHLQRIVIVGHSLGGMLGTLWLSEREHRHILGLINIEGNLHPEDASYSRLASAAYRDLACDTHRWLHWYRQVLLEERVLREHGHSLACRRYYASLQFTQPDAFLANSQEILERTAVSETHPEPAMARLYRNIMLPKIYLWGSESISKQTQQYLAHHELAHHAFQGAGHWPMIDQPAECYRVIDEWCGGLE
jgi:pimeloyl-ACP methyl ester carboxylesterase